MLEWPWLIYNNYPLAKMLDRGMSMMMVLVPDIFIALPSSIVDRLLQSFLNAFVLREGAMILLGEQLIGKGLLQKSLGVPDVNQNISC